MNKIFLALCILMLIGTGCTSKRKEPCMKVQINITGKLNPNEFKGHGGVFYSICLDLINNTDSVTSFWVMSCSWQDNWIFNTDTVRFYSQGCDKNYPIVEKIEPGQKLTYDGVLHCLDTLNSINQTTIKIGFVLIKEKEFLETSDFRNVLTGKILERKDIIWSESIQIDR